MKFMKWGKDGGPESGVFGFWLIEIKCLFSIVLLRFEADRREAFHSHAFHALTWWLKGEVREYHKDGRVLDWCPSIFPKWTPRSCFHKIRPLKRTWALSLRGPWAKSWYEFRPGTNLTTKLGHGRKVITQSTDPLKETI